ncbi:MAG: primosomal protein N' [SAR86 cluster bacterium]|uniref:Replication restart protein PriA n=1 Tax=SAR86 cluster bacterium TaxID=2030880 RepID=A0A2A5B310_9GAMM|nr:MAG: primosomal protein N' [SAR86 cluster bacterium]
MPNNQNSKYHGLVFRVAVPSPLRRVFDYLPPVIDGDQHSSSLPSSDTEFSSSKVQPGVRVRVSFGNRKLIGIVVAIGADSSLDKKKLKPVIEILDQKPLFTPGVFKILLWAANYYQHSLGEVFATALPRKLRVGHTQKQGQQVWTVQGSPTEKEISSLSRAIKQKALFELIETKGKLSRAQCQDAGFSPVLLTRLTEKKLIRSQLIPAEAAKPFELLNDRDSELTLNDNQLAAVTSITEKLDTFSCFLLDGVTGSGKTEVYMQVMRKQLALGKQCLVLVPEIGLTPQTIARFEERFDCPVVSLHSGLNESERLNAWNCSRDGSAGIIIGTRSAVFTPMAAPGLIIIDEEHDSSFKQQDSFRYSARDIAVVRAREENICVVLGSATPSLESLHNANSNKFIHLKLPQRTGKVTTSNSMEVIDVANETLREGFSEQLLYKIQRHIENKNQVLVFINRRGFAPILNCQSCGWIAECENCIAQFTVHANPSSLRCHHCGAFKQLPRYCQNCKSKDLNTIGVGTQRVEAFLNKQFPDTTILRIDRDSTRRKSSLAKMLERINQGDPCILLGTQMLAKGHHFPNITLVAILDADAGLFSADFRGQEHMAQTIVQVAGRAGRAERAGEVLIQSRHSAHTTLQSLITGTYAEFAETQLKERQNAAMPPFHHLCLLRAESPNLEIPLHFLDKVATIVDKLCHQAKLPVERLGPIPAPMEKRAGRFRIHLILKSRSRGALQTLLTQLCEQLDNLKFPAKLRLSIDVDPQDMT